MCKLVTDAHFLTDKIASFSLWGGGGGGKKGGGLSINIIWFSKKDVMLYYMA